MPEQSNDYRVVVFGAGGVGKSSLVLSCNKNICTLQITDTTGSHQFPAMQRLSISKGHAFILVYSVCSRQSLEELRPIWEVIRELKGPDLSQIPIMLVGNKCDESAELREVTTSEGQAQAGEWGVSFMETSAKTNHNVKQLFQELLNLEKSRNVSLQIGVNNNSRCYGIYGCFQLTPPWTSEHRPVALFPEALQKIEPRYFYYTRKNLKKSIYIDLNEYDVIGSTDINPLKPVYLVAHGYMEGGGIYWIAEVAEELLKLEDCSVIVVDWHGGSGPPYTQAVANIRLVGAVTSHLLHDLSKRTGRKKLDHVHCIGHSLGAHMCGYVGYALQNDFPDAKLTLGRITGLDPAEPHFAKSKPPIRLDRTAAHYVDIIHTDASQFIRGGFGMTEKIGHVDYYPNGGTNQPGCGKSVVQYISAANGSFFLGVRRYFGCNHLKSHEFFVESINPGKECSFTSIQCSTYDDFLAGKCFHCGNRNQHCIRFGFHGKKDYDDLIRRRIIAPNTNLALYFITGEKRPYCRAHYRVTVQISASDESIRHGGEVGQLFFTIHSTTDGKGARTNAVPLNSGGYHEPGKIYTAVIPTNEIPKLKAVEVEWRHTSSVFNPLTWRILAVPKIYIEKITVDSLEIHESITVCPKDGKPLQNSKPAFMISSYC